MFRIRAFVSFFHICNVKYFGSIVRFDLEYAIIVNKLDIYMIIIERLIGAMQYKRIRINSGPTVGEIQGSRTARSLFVSPCHVSLRKASRKT